MVCVRVLCSERVMARGTLKYWPPIHLMTSSIEDLPAGGMKNSHQLAALLLNQLKLVNLSVVQNCLQYVMLVLLLVIFLAMLHKKLIFFGLCFIENVCPFQEMLSSLHNTQFSLKLSSFFSLLWGLHKFIRFDVMSNA